jgi:hypothetical protein
MSLAASSQLQGKLLLCSPAPNAHLAHVCMEVRGGTASCTVSGDGATMAGAAASTVVSPHSLATTMTPPWHSSRSATSQVCSTLAGGSYSRCRAGLGLAWLTSAVAVPASCGDSAQGQFTESGTRTRRSVVYHRSLSASIQAHGGEHLNQFHILCIQCICLLIFFDRDI